jgi:hypothetical protein
LGTNPLEPSPRLGRCWPIAKAETEAISAADSTAITKARIAGDSESGVVETDEAAACYLSVSTAIKSTRACCAKEIPLYPMPSSAHRRRSWVGPHVGERRQRLEMAIAVCGLSSDSRSLHTSTLFKDHGSRRKSIAPWVDSYAIYASPRVTFVSGTHV